MQVNFISSKGIDEDCVIHLKSDNIEIMRYDKTDEVIGKRFKSLPPSYQIELEKSTKSSDFIFDCVHLLYYKCHKKSELWWFLYRYS